MRQFNILDHATDFAQKLTQKTKFLALVCLSVVVVAGLSLAIYHGSANVQYKTAIGHTGKDIANSSKANIVLVHGAYADGSSWSKVIPILYLNAKLSP